MTKHPHSATCLRIADAGAVHGGRMIFLVHPLLVHFPVALWLTSGLFDLLYLRTSDQFYLRAARLLIGLGLVGSVFAIASGFRDFLSFKPEEIGPAFTSRHNPHSLTAYGATIVYLYSFWTRGKATPSRSLLLAMVVVGSILIAVAAHLGGIIRTVM
jgi:uncharacterized membrane protein